MLEDSDTMRSILVKNLLAIGLQASEIQQAQNGVEAIRKLNLQKFDLLVLDIIMDGVNGISVLKEAKKNQPDARVIMCSTFSEKETVIELIDIGIDDFVVKPFTEERLRDALMRNVMAISASQQPAG